MYKVYCYDNYTLNKTFKDSDRIEAYFYYGKVRSAYNNGTVLLVWNIHSDHEKEKNHGYNSEFK